MTKQQLPLPFPPDKPVYKTHRVYFHTELKIIKVVDRYKNTLAEVKVDIMPVSRGTNGHSRIGKSGKTVVRNARGHRNVYYRYLNTQEDIDLWVKSINKANR